MSDRYTAPQWERAALLTIDVQEDFLRPGSATWSPDKDHAVSVTAEYLSSTKLLVKVDTSWFIFDKKAVQLSE